MYVPEFVCGIVFTILVEIAIAIAFTIYSSNKEEEYDEETDYRDKKSEQRND